MGRLQTSTKIQQLLTSKNRSRTEYYMSTYNIVVPNAVFVWPLLISADFNKLKIC